VELLGRAGRVGVLSIEGDSMRPTLRSGQRVAVEFGRGALERGDLVLFRQVDYLVVHRLLGPASREDGAPHLRTRGDGRSPLDPPLERARIRGRVVAVEHAGAWRDLDAPAARLYGLLVALHDLAWSAAAIAARRCDRRLEVAVAAGDRAALRAVHRVLYRACHRRVRHVDPASTGPAAILPR